MNFSTLITKVTADSKMEKSLCRNITKEVFKIITETLNVGEPVKISGFGTLKVKKRKQSFGRNFSTGKRTLIPPSFYIYYKPAKKFIDSLNK